jgi:hypothetical protein
MTFPVKIRKMIGYDNGLSDIYLDVTGPGPSGSGQTAGSVVLTGIPTANLAGVVQGNTYSMTFA